MSLKEQLRDVWESVLGTSDFSDNDNIMDIGGNSLMIYKISALSKEKYAVELSPMDLMMYPNIKMSREIIRFENVKKEYTVGTLSTQVLNGVDFTVDEGELAVIVGTSGAGKSTILNIIGGMDTPTSGKVVVDGDDISGYK